MKKFLYIFPILYTISSILYIMAFLEGCMKYL